LQRNCATRPRKPPRASRRRSSRRTPRSSTRRWRQQRRAAGSRTRSPSQVRPCNRAPAPPRADAPAWRLCAE
jgi:hypothetical protein